MEQVGGDQEADARVVDVLVVDDQAPFRAAARAVIARVPGFELVAEATSGEEAVELVGRLRPAVVLMDINMGVMDGLEATRIITTAYPDTFVVLVSTYELIDLPPSALNRRIVRSAVGAVHGQAPTRTWPTRRGP